MSKGSSTYTGAYSRYFDVQGPQWVLPPSEIHSVYPPDGDEKAPPLSQIPFITLGRRSLPWERELGILSGTPLGGLDESDYPWVALLVFREDELEWTDSNGATHLNIFKGERRSSLYISGTYAPRYTSAKGQHRPPSHRHPQVDYAETG